MIEFGSLVSQQENENDGETCAAIYARTSSVNQKFGYSLDEQIRLCFKRCRLLGWEVVFVFRDEAESGKDTERPMFQTMMAEAERGQFDVVVFWKLDRLSRSLLHAVQIESSLREYEVALYSVTEQIDTTTSAGRFNFRNLASAAEFEREMIGERSEMGLKARALEGKWPNDSPPYGYEVSEHGELSVLPREAVVVRWIFDRYLEVKSMPEVAWELNNRTGRVVSTSEWDASRVKSILSNEVYTGEFELAGVKQSVPAYRIIDDAVFSAATDTRFRFRTDDENRPPMEDHRKNPIVDDILEQYTMFCSEATSE
jgi:site-specific DNA recombinase